MKDYFRICDGNRSEEPCSLCGIYHKENIVPRAIFKSQTGWARDLIICGGCALMIYERITRFLKRGPRKPIPNEQRSRIYIRDNHNCRYCGATENLSIDHVIPVIQGGTDVDENLVAACMSCNLKKSGRTPEEAGMSLGE